MVLIGPLDLCVGSISCNNEALAETMVFNIVSLSSLFLSVCIPRSLSCLDRTIFVELLL
eukprot:m.270390 g.270390  ORF g.270390 m.270390 type:complete len:59 (+) comp47146_c0_seq1:102-278(+)